MSDSASWSVQKSMVVALKSDVVLSSLLNGQSVYDHVPQRAAYPFISIGNAVARDWSMSTSESGSEHALTLHIWSKAKGKMQCYEIMNAVRHVLHDVGLVVEGHELVNLRFEFSDARLDPDGETYHGIMRFRAVTEVAS
jgi:Protein of unknown function (DUF3168)